MWDTNFFLLSRSSEEEEHHYDVVEGLEDVLDIPSGGSNFGESELYAEMADYGNIYIMFSLFHILFILKNN